MRMPRQQPNRADRLESSQPQAERTRRCVRRAVASIPVATINKTPARALV